MCRRWRSARCWSRAAMTSIARPAPRARMEALNEDVPDLIVADYQLPNMDGRELTRQLRLNERTRAIPDCADDQRPAHGRAGRPGERRRRLCPEIARSAAAADAHHRRCCAAAATRSTEPGVEFRRGQLLIVDSSATQALAVPVAVVAGGLFGLCRRQSGRTRWRRSTPSPGGLHRDQPARRRVRWRGGLPRGLRRCAMQGRGERCAPAFRGGRPWRRRQGAERGSAEVRICGRGGRRRLPRFRHRHPEASPAHARAPPAHGGRGAAGSTRSARTRGWRSNSSASLWRA